MMISVTRLWLDSYRWFSRPTRLWLDSFESESSQIWLTTHESSTTLVWRPWPERTQTGSFRLRRVGAALTGIMGPRLTQIDAELTTAACICIAGFNRQGLFRSQTAYCVLSRTVSCLTSELGQGTSTRRNSRISSGGSWRTGPGWIQVGDSHRRIQWGRGQGVKLLQFHAWQGWPVVIQISISRQNPTKNWTINSYSRIFFNPRPAGVWLVTHPAGGGGGQRAPLRSPKLLDRFPNFMRHSIALYVNYPYKVKNLTQRSLMTSQVRWKSEFSTFRAWWHRRIKSRC